MKRKKHFDKSVYRSLTLITQFGVNMLVPICMMSALGIFLDKKLDTSYWMVILFFVGAIAGGQNIYRMAKKLYSEPSVRDSMRTGKKEQNKGNAANRDIKGQK